MNAAVSIVLLAAVLGVIVFLLSRRENTRRSQYGPAGLSEFRTDLPLDECFDEIERQRKTRVRVRVPPGKGRRLSAASHPAPAHPAAAGHPVYPPAGPRSSDRSDPDLHPRGLWLQGAAVPAGNA